MDADATDDEEGIVERGGRLKKKARELYTIESPEDDDSLIKAPIQEDEQAPFSNSESRASEEAHALAARAAYDMITTFPN